MSFKDRCIIVTGASGNLGRAVVHAFAEPGAHVALVDRNATAVAAALADLGYANDKRFMPVIGDLLDQAQVTEMVATVVKRFGGVHVLCNLAGGFRVGEAVHETTDANWNFLFDINARTVLHAARGGAAHARAACGRARRTRQNRQRGRVWRATRSSADGRLRRVESQSDPHDRINGHRAKRTGHQRQLRATHHARQTTESRRYAQF